MESNDNFRALAENANDRILIVTGEREHVYANKRRHPSQRDSVFRKFLKSGCKTLSMGGTHRYNFPYWSQRVWDADLYELLRKYGLKPADFRKT